MRSPLKIGSAFRAIWPLVFLTAATVALSEGGAAAQEAESHPLDSALEMLDLKAKPGPMPDFVEQSRRGKQPGDYMPVGVKPTARSLKPKTPAEVESMTAELDAARAAQLSGKRPKPPSKPAKAVGKSVPVAKKESTNH